MQSHPGREEAEASSQALNKPWPPPSAKVEPVSFDSSARSSSLSSILFSSPDEIAQAMLGLLAEMEASLHGSQKAVLASDGLGLENCTREQVRLHRALEILLWPPAWPGTSDANGVRKDVCNDDDVRKDVRKDTRKDTRNDVRGNALGIPKPALQCAPRLAAELLAAECRVLHATRVQAALLLRARQFQRILANVAAARGAPCGAWFGQSGQR